MFLFCPGGFGNTVVEVIKFEVVSSETKLLPFIYKNVTVYFLGYNLFATENSRHLFHFSWTIHTIWSFQRSNVFEIRNFSSVMPLN
jgi:hypothetical protein